MCKFAKIFDVKDTQIIFMLTTDEDSGYPIIRAITLGEGDDPIELILDTGFGDNEIMLRSEAFENIGQKIAETFVNDMRGFLE